MYAYCTCPLPNRSRLLNDKHIECAAIMREWLKQPWFWAAISAIVALLGFLFTHFVGKRRLRYWRLQHLLDKERSVYATLPLPRRISTSDSSGAPTQQYVSSVARSLLGFDSLPASTLKDSRDDLRRLLSNLRTTHQTLVSALEPFSTGEARKFIEEFDVFAAKFSTLYHAGQIPHNARTHCHEVEQTISALDAKMPGTTTGWQDIAALRNSVVMYDQDVIVPLMVDVLDRAQLEITMIGQAIRDKDFGKAIIIKERFWFEVKGFYKELDETLTKMGEIAARL